MELIILALLIAAFVLYDYAAGIRYAVTARYSDNRIDARVFDPFVRLTVTLGDAPVLEARVFKVKIFKVRLMTNREGHSKLNVRRWLRSVEYRELEARAAYAMENPFLTGAAYAALNFLGSLIRMGDVRLRPDFTADAAYADIRAHVNLSLSHTIANYLTRRTATWSKT